MAEPTTSTEPSAEDRDARAPERGSSARSVVASRKTRVRDLGRGPIGRFMGATAWLYLQLVFWTTRWRRVGLAEADAVLTSDRVVVAIWHGRIFATPIFRPRHRRMAAMVSNNRDGDVVARFLAGFGFEAVRGSSADPRKPGKPRGGARAAAAGLRAVKEGVVLAVIPDGPRGPAWRAKSGVAWIAAASDAVVLPMGTSFRRAKVFKSWDRFVLPWPFNHGSVVIGPPIAPPGPRASEDEMERFRAAIEDGLVAATREADRLVGAVGGDPLRDEAL